MTLALGNGTYGIFAVLYILALIFLGITSLRKGHWIMFLLGITSLRKGHWIMFLVGIPLPIFWVIGAVIPPVNRD